MTEDGNEAGVVIETQDPPPVESATTTSGAKDNTGGSLHGGKQDDYQRDPNNNATTLDVVSTWSEGTSVHGIPYALDRQHFLRWKRLLWWIILLAFFGVMCFLVYELIKEYQNYETETTVYWRAPDSLPFPHVTVCSSNLFQQSRMESTGIQFPRNDKELKLISQPFEAFFRNTITKFNGIVRNNTDVWKPVITHLGLCWTFSTVKRVYSPGPAGGLVFSGYLDNSDFLTITEELGVYVFITQPGIQIADQMPFAVAKPGELSWISIKSTEFFRERDHPWSTCKSEAPEYTQPRCRALCKFQYLEQQCGCRGLGDNRKQVESLPYCNTADEECTTLEKQDAPAFLESCDCFPPPCHETVYTTRSNTLKLSAPFVLQLSERLNVSLAEFQQNVVHLRINYDTICEEVSEETKVQTLAGLFAAIGGQFGLWAGISFISILEVIGELFLFRFIPRLWGDHRLYGMGSKTKTA